MRSGGPRNSLTHTSSSGPLGFWRLTESDDWVGEREMNPRALKGVEVERGTADSAVLEGSGRRSQPKDADDADDDDDRCG